MRGEHNIQITTVNQSDMLPTAEERATQLLTQEPVFDEGPGVRFIINFRYLTSFVSIAFCQ